MLEMRIIIYAGGTRAKWEREKLLTYVQKLAPIIFYFFFILISPVHEVAVQLWQY